MKQEFESNFPTYSRDEIYYLIRKRVLDISLFKQFKSYFEQYGLWFMAAHNGDLAVVNFLIGVGIDINSKDEYGRTALMVAALWKRLSVVKFLIEVGVDINGKDEHGRTALIFAYHWIDVHQKMSDNDIKIKLIKANKNNKTLNYLEQKMNEARV